MGQVMERVGVVLLSTRPPLAGIVSVYRDVRNRTEDEPILTGDQCVPYPQHLIERSHTPRPPMTTPHEQKPRDADYGQYPRPQLVSHHATWTAVSTRQRRAGL